MTSADAGPLDTGPLHDDGPAAPPRQNGELVFNAPWQSRIFATTMRLHEQGRFEWDTFRDRLIANIAAHEQDHTGEDFDYWSCWLRALEDLMSSIGLVEQAEIDDTALALAARQPGHDHHDH